MLSIALLASMCTGTPRESARAAVADVQSLPSGVRRQTRYLSLYHLPPTEREQVRLAVDYLLNAVSRARRVTRTTCLADGSLARVDLAAYADLKDQTTYTELHTAWEQLAAQDPYFHLRTQIVAPPDARQSTRTSARPPARATAGSIKTVTVDGGWVGVEQAEKLRNETGSFGAVLRADFFIARVATAPDYYQWSGTADNEQEFFSELGIDLKAINRLAADSAANLLRSRVTGKPRRVVFRPGPLGGNWVTKDVAAEAPDKDPIRTPVDFLDQRFRFDASEVFYARANRFWGTALFNAEGRRQNAVPVQVATDSTAPRGHQELVPLISCIRCHELSGGESGLQPFSDDQTLLPQPRSEYPAVEERIGELYDVGRLNNQIARNRQDYVEAVASATGGATPRQAATALVESYGDYVYNPVGLAVAASEVGLGRDDFRSALSSSRDPILMAVALGQQVSRKSWEASFQEAILLAESERQ